jgi:hypothetical protein
LCRSKQDVVEERSSRGLFVFHSSIYPGLNTCIGDINYSTFFQTMIWITAMLTIHFAVEAALFITILVERSNHEGGVVRRRAEQWFVPHDGRNEAHAVALTVIWIIFCVVDIMGLALILQLLSFHLHLQKKKLSTYLYIVQENQRKREVLRKAGLRRAKRIETMAHARQEGRSFLAMRLRCGGLAVVSTYCPCCDPLPPDEEEEEEELEFGSMPKPKSSVPPQKKSNGVTFLSLKKSSPPSKQPAEEEEKETEPTSGTEDHADEEAPPRTV